MTVSTGKFKQMRGFDRGASADLFRRKQAEIVRRSNRDAIRSADDGPDGPDGRPHDGT